MSDFKKIKVRDLRRMIKDLNLKSKNPDLKGYSYKKKAQLIELLMPMNLAETDLQKYRSERRKMSDKQKEALALGRAKAKAKKAGKKKPVKMIVAEVKKVEDPQTDLYKVMIVDDKGEVKTKGEYKIESQAIKSFDDTTKVNNNMKVYVVEFMKNGVRQVIRSYKKPMVNMNSKKRFKKHMMYKGKKAVMADTKQEHLDLKKKGYTHSKIVNSPKKMDKEKMKKSSY